MGRFTLKGEDIVRRIILREVGEPEQLHIEEAAESPRPGSREVLVAVEAAGIN